MAFLIVIISVNTKFNASSWLVVIYSNRQIHFPVIANRLRRLDNRLMARIGDKWSVKAVFGKDGLPFLISPSAS